MWLLFIYSIPFPLIYYSSLRLIFFKLPVGSQLGSLYISCVFQSVVGATWFLFLPKILSKIQLPNRYGAVLALSSELSITLPYVYVKPRLGRSSWESKRGCLLKLRRYGLHCRNFYWNCVYANIYDFETQVWSIFCLDNSLIIFVRHPWSLRTIKRCKYIFFSSKAFSLRCVDS